jgi:hypothetical protein
MNERTTLWSRTLGVAFASALALMLLGCGGGSSTPAPFIGATVVGFTPRAAGAGLGAGAAVLVADAGTGAPLSGAVVTVNGSTLNYDEGAGDYEGLAPIAAGSQVAVSVALNGKIYRATGQLDSYPAVTAPAPGETWSRPRAARGDLAAQGAAGRATTPSAWSTPPIRTVRWSGRPTSSSTGARHGRDLPAATRFAHRR